MATIKIILDDAEYPEQVEDDLMKAITDKRGRELEAKNFDDPVMNELVDVVDGEYQRMYVGLIKEILDILKE